MPLHMAPELNRVPPPPLVPVGPVNPCNTQLQIQPPHTPTSQCSPLNIPTTPSGPNCSPNGPSSCSTSNSPLHMRPPVPIKLENENGFEPLERQRCNTWPLHKPEFSEPPEKDDPCSEQITKEVKMGDGIVAPTAMVQPGSLPKKNSSRRNAWGNMSYADLITTAINAAPEKKLTLSQIYDWMVNSVNYFKDKGDSNSSAGWKVSLENKLQ